MKKQYYIYSDVHIGKKLPDDGKLHMMSLQYLQQQAKEYATNDIEFIGVVCGDLFDSRLHLNPVDILKAREFINNMCDTFDRIYLVTGNHDMYNSTPGSPNILDIFKNEKISVVKSFLQNNDGVFVPFDDPILSDKDMFMEMTADDEYCFCHQAISGIAPPIADGIIPDYMFDHFKLAVAGHIHVRNISRKVISIGAPTSFSFSDADVNNFGALYINSDGEYKFIDSPYFLKYKTLNINELKDIDQIITLQPREEYCVKLKVNPDIALKVDYALDNNLTAEFALFKNERQLSDIEQNVDICEDLHTGDSNSILTVLRKEFENTPDVLSVFNNIITDVIRETEENE